MQVACDMHVYMTELYFSVLPVTSLTIRHKAQLKQHTIFGNKKLTMRNHRRSDMHDKEWLWSLLGIGIPANDLLYVMFLILLVPPFSTDSLAVDLSSKGKTSVPFQAISDNVTILDLSHNKIADISWFKPYQCLHKLLLRGNELSEFPNLTNISTSLRYLDLAYNDIHAVTKEHLQILNLSHLILSSNDMDIFPDMEEPWGFAMETLDLDDNELSTVPRIPALKETAKIPMRDNPIRCDCKLQFRNYCNTEETQCYKPQKFRGDNLQDFNMSWDRGGKSVAM